MAVSAEKLAVYRDNLRRLLGRQTTAVEKAALNLARAEAGQFAKQLVGEYHVRRVILFGSVARGWPLRTDSDIDLAVEGMSGADFYKLAGDIFSPSGRRIDLVRLEKLPSAFCKAILAQGILLVDER